MPTKAASTTKNPAWIEETQNQQLSIWGRSLEVPYGPHNLSDGGGGEGAYILNGIYEIIENMYYQVINIIKFIENTITYGVFMMSDRENSS